MRKARGERHSSNGVPKGCAWLASGLTEMNEGKIRKSTWTMRYEESWAKQKKEGVR